MTAILKVDEIQDTSGNNIINESSDTITIGASGDTTNIVGTLQNNGSALNFATVNGITMADIFRLNTNLSFNSSSTTTITANLERDDTTGAGFIGTGMSESSGIFTFPSTGIYKVDFNPAFYRDGDSQWIESKIQVTTNNSSYADLTSSDIFIHRTTSTNTYIAGHLSALVDVTSTSNVKVRFNIAGALGPIILRGSTTKNNTCMIFVRLGDT